VFVTHKHKNVFVICDVGIWSPYLRSQKNATCHKMYCAISHIHNDATLAVVLALQGELEGKRRPIAQAPKVKEGILEVSLSRGALPTL
jgi:hypothetical protein